MNTRQSLAGIKVLSEHLAELLRRYPTDQQTLVSFLRFSMNPNIRRKKIDVPGLKDDVSNAVDVHTLQTRSGQRHPEHVLPKNQVRNLLLGPLAVKQLTRKAF